MHRLPLHEPSSVQNTKSSELAINTKVPLCNETFHLLKLCCEIRYHVHARSKPWRAGVSNTRHIRQGDEEGLLVVFFLRATTGQCNKSSPQWRSQKLCVGADPSAGAARVDCSMYNMILIEARRSN